MVTVPSPQPSAGVLLGGANGGPHAPTPRSKPLVQSGCKLLLKARAKGCRKLLPARLEDEMASRRRLVQATHQSPSLGTPAAAAVEPLDAGSSLALPWDRGGD